MHFSSNRSKLVGQSQQLNSAQKPTAKKGSLKVKRAGKPCPSAKVEKPSMPHKYKTIMCKNFTEGKVCPFGRKCNYAHGQMELSQALSESAPASLDSSPVPIKELPQEEDEVYDAVFQGRETSDGKPDWIKQLMLSDAKRRPQSPRGKPDFCHAVAESSLEAFVQNSEFSGSQQNKKLFDTGIQQFSIGCQSAKSEASTRASEAEDSDAQASDASQAEPRTHFAANLTEKESTDNFDDLLYLPVSISSFQPMVYSTILSGIQSKFEHVASCSVDVAKKQVDVDQNFVKCPDDAKLEASREVLSEQIMTSITQAPQRQLVRRLSCFEQICSTENEEEESGQVAPSHEVVTQISHQHQSQPKTVQQAAMEAPTNRFDLSRLKQCSVFVPSEQAFPLISQHEASPLYERSRMHNNQGRKFNKMRKFCRQDTATSSQHQITAF